MRKLIVAWALFGLALVPVISCLEAVGQINIYTSIPPCPFGTDIYQYAVKVVQGTTQSSSVTPNDPLGEGLYHTSVNVHNPSANVVPYRIKLAIAGHNGLPGTITVPFVVHQLASDEVTQYDGEDFNSMLAQMGPVPGFYEGYFVIECEAELDVVAVYTGSILGNFALATMETERVPARVTRVSCCVGLNPTTINTGPLTSQWPPNTPWQSPWLITEVPVVSTLVLGDAPLSSYIPGCSWPPPSDPSAGWVGTNCPCSGGSTGPGDYVYTLYFCLCCDFSNVVLSFKFSADDIVADVLLNDQQLDPSYSSGYGATGWVWLSSASPNDPNNLFLCGMNHLDIKVTNASQGPSGLMVEFGTIFAETGGYCP